MEPLSNEETARLFTIFHRVTGLLLAVSGGPDSAALLNLVRRWRDQTASPIPIVVATVDHGLREQSRHEAETVAEWAKKAGFQHEILTWTGDKPATRLQETARRVRYHLLAAFARQQNLSHLVTAHTLDDQAETLLMRLSRGSGPLGLSGMKKESSVGGIRHIRPFLEVPKRRLIDTCHTLEVPFFEDPSNHNPQFARTRWRTLLPLLEVEGLTASRLSRFAQRMEQVNEALAQQTETVLVAAALSGAQHCYKAEVILAAPFEIVVRCLMESTLRALGLTDVASERNRPALLRLEKTERLATELVTAFQLKTALRRTLAGLMITLTLKGELVLAPENARKRGTKHASTPAVS